MSLDDDIDLSSACHEEMPDQVTSLRTAADNLVASAIIFHETTQAVSNHVLRLGAPDGDGGVLGIVRLNIGITEEQLRLTLHAHRLVWV